MQCQYVSDGPELALGLLVEAIQALHSVQFITAVTVIAELGDLRRFELPRQLMSYPGLIPSEHTTLLTPALLLHAGSNEQHLTPPVLPLYDSGSHINASLTLSAFLLPVLPVRHDGLQCNAAGVT